MFFVTKGPRFKGCKEEYQFSRSMFMKINDPSIVF
jgi:hypothetical protein